MPVMEVSVPVTKCNVFMKNSSSKKIRTQGHRTNDGEAEGRRGRPNRGANCTRGGSKRRQEKERSKKEEKGEKEGRKTDREETCLTVGGEGLAR